MSTADTARKDVQTLLFVLPDGNFGPKTIAAFNALANATEWPPVAASPVPAPSSPTAPVVSTGVVIRGADTVDLISATSIKQMTALIGRVPAFVGRYFNGPYEYQHAKENGPANEGGIRILPIGDQTPSVGGSQQQGTADGEKNATDIINTFGLDYLTKQGTEFYTALDVEGQPSLSAAYWTGWSSAMIDTAKSLSGGALTFLPILYASEGDGPTWIALKAAMAAGAQCFGVWVASYITTTANNLPIPSTWNPSKARMSMPDGSTPPNVPVLIWQQAGGFEGTVYEPHDPDLVSPNTDPAAFLQRLILPPV